MLTKNDFSADEAQADGMAPDDNQGIFPFYGNFSKTIMN